MCSADSAAATGLTVGAGANVQLGNNVLSLGCNDLTIQAAGTLQGQQSTILLSGNWNNQGTFDPGTGTVYLTDGCGPGAVAQITGNSTFYNLTASTTSDKVVQLEAGSTQKVLNHLSLSGVVGYGLLTVLSSIPGVQAFLDLDPAAGQSIEVIDVMDNGASGQQIKAFDSVNSGNNSNWLFLFRQPGSGTNPLPPPTPGTVPAASTLGIAALIAVLLLLATRRLPASASPSLPRRGPGGG